MTEREQIKEELRKEYQERYINESRFMKKISELFAQKAYDSLGHKINRVTDINQSQLDAFERRILTEFWKSDMSIKKATDNSDSLIKEFKSLKKYIVFLGVMICVITGAIVTILINK